MSDVQGMIDEALFHVDASVVRAHLAEIAWNGRRLAYTDKRLPSEYQCRSALAFILAGPNAFRAKA